MKKTSALLLAIIFALAVFFTASAQAAETIWLSATGVTSFKTGETVVVTVNAVSGTPIQGLTFQIRYDPACLQPLKATSPIPGMNGMNLPQTPGVVDATFASTTPQVANGALAEVRFITLGECQTSLTLERAEIAIRSQDGFAAPLPNVAIGEKSVPLSVSAEQGTSDLPEPVVGGTPLVLNAEENSGQLPSWLIILFSLLAGVIGVLVAVNLLRKP